MIEAILFLLAALSPDFSFSNPERGGFEADMFSVEPEGNIEHTLSFLIAQEDRDLERTLKNLQIAPEDELAVTALRNSEGVARITYLYRLDLAEGEKQWVCRVRFGPENDIGLARTMRWCLSFIGGDEYRPTIRIPTG